MPNDVGLNNTGTIEVRDWESLLCAGAQEVFQMMIGISLDKCAEDSSAQAGGYTSVIGLTGPINGVFAIRCDEPTAIGIASGMLGIDAEAAKAEIWDALGEVCNMVIGNFKAKVGEMGEQSKLSVPTVIHGHDYRVRPLVNGSAVECIMQTANGKMQFRLDYKLA
jgi:chemotaxis protein CheX